MSGVNMIMFVLCCVMKIVEMTAGGGGREPRPRRRYRRRPPRRRTHQGGIGKVMLEAECGGKVPDCNSNHTGAVCGVGGGERNTTSCLSNASSQDPDFIQDNSDYQWFLDYGYRDGGVHHHTSILSSLSESYGGLEDVGYYEALSKNLDANLAEADMDTFRTEDIHALLTTLPAMCTDMQLATDVSHQGEMFASVSGSMMAKFDFDSSMSPHSSSQGEESAASPDTMSICKSELLFSPVKETTMPGANFSIDSLDCDLFNEQDIMLTCQANKDNYTIAFEGSMTMYSEESYHRENEKNEENWICKKHPKLENSMARSDSGLTTWSKLKKRSSENQLRRHPSGNNNTPGEDNTSFSMNDNALKSQSMPNLHKQRHRPLSYSKYSSNSSVESKKSCVKVFDIQHQNTSSVSDMAMSMDGASINSDKNNKPPHNFSLVKLFMKQKSISAEGMSTAMDQSSASECWPGSQSESESFECKNKKETSFEDSLVDPKSTGGAIRRHDLIQEECEDISERSESVEQLTESPSRADSIFNSYEQDKCFHKIPLKCNINNNNSVEKIRQGTQTKRYTSSGASLSSETSNFTSTESTDCTKINKPTIILSKHSATQFPVHLMNKSMQTSINYTNSKLKKSVYGNDYVRVVQPSFLSKLKKESDAQKPIYVVYPNYTLPDLEFLKEKQEDVTKVYLMPQRFDEEKKKPPVVPRGRRPFSCNDMEALKKKGFSHIRDWDSLTFLLPAECRQVLADVPEFMDVMKENDELLKPKEKPLFCVSPPMRPKRPVSCEYSYDKYGTNVSSSSSTATQPSSGYRGSSTMLTDSSQNSPAPTNNFNPLFVYRYDSVTSSEASLMMSEKQRSISTVAPQVPKRSISLPEQKGKKNESIPPRPPLPKGILRKNMDSKLRKNIANNKRYSMFEMGETDEYSEEDTAPNFVKRKSLHEPYYMGQRRTFSEHSTETEDEGVEAGHATDSSIDERFENMKIRPPTPPLPKTNDFNMSTDELDQLEDFLKMSGISCSDPNEWDENELLKLRSHVSKFLTLKINKDQCDLNGKKQVSFAEKLDLNNEYNTPPNSPNVSTRHYQNKTLVDMPICEEGELSPEGYSSPKLENVPLEKPSPIDLSQKKNLISAVTQSVEQLIHHFSVANDQGELNTLGDAELNPACAKLVLSSLCPALYALLSDGLKPSLDSPFGAINNSVWQVVEASAQQGPLTKALNELVMKINSEDVITEGMSKFNAFVFGLLNVRSLDAWASYLRTRETVLRKHYSNESLLILAQTGGATVRSLLDTLIATLQPLALLPFQIDLLFEYRQLHLSLKRMDSYHQPTTSPTHIKYSPPHLTNKQLTLMKLVRSIQSSMSCDESEDISAATMIRRYSPNLLTQECTDPSLPDLLNSSAYTKTQIRDDKQRPRSYVDPNITLSQVPGFKLVDDAAGTIKKRWSGIHMGSKFGQAFDRLATDTEEEYTDSLENNVNRRRMANENFNNHEGSSPALSSDDGPESLSSNPEDNLPLNGKFRRLQMKWEMLSGRDVNNQPSPPLSPTHSVGKSKIPRLVPSPVKQSAIPVLSPKTPPVSKMPVKKVVTPPGIVGAKKQPVRTPLTGLPKKNNVVTRTSRVDQLDNPESRSHPVRPSSLPYRPVSANGQGGKGSKLTPPRRAVSSSVTRKPTQNQSQSKTPKVVKTLAHRLPSDNGHLSFNEGEKLKVILDVDSKWLLCCRGDQKGLVPRSAVIPLG